MLIHRSYKPQLPPGFTWGWYDTTAGTALCDRQLCAEADDDLGTLQARAETLSTLYTPVFFGTTDPILPANN